MLQAVLTVATGLPGYYRQLILLAKQIFEQNSYNTKHIFLNQDWTLLKACWCSVFVESFVHMFRHKRKLIPFLHMTCVEAAK